MDLTGILKPGMKLFTPIAGEVTVQKIEKHVTFPIKCTLYDNITTMFTKDGRYTCEAEAECLLFPSKDYRRWDNSIVAKLLNLKKGDYLLSDTGVFIFNGKVHDFGKFGSLAGVHQNGEIVITESPYWCNELRGVATDEEIEDFNTRLYTKHKLVFDKDTCKLIKVDGRVPKAESFYYISCDLKVHCMAEHFTDKCNELFDSGNYFMSLSEAEECLRKIKRVFKFYEK